MRRIHPAWQVFWWAVLTAVLADWAGEAIVGGALPIACGWLILTFVALIEAVAKIHAIRLAGEAR